MSKTAHKLMASSGGDTGYEIEQSWMSNVGNGSYLKRDYGSAANSYTKWTFSTWFKNTSENYAGGSLWTSWDGSTQSDTSYGWIGFYQDKLQVGGWSTNWRVTNRVFRDVAAWYHIVVAIDTNESTADNRVRIYINGVEETSFATKNNPSTNTQLPWNKQQQHRIGAINSSTPYYLGAYLAETQVIDGSQLTPSSFGETDAATGQWIPKEYEGTYPAYSFYLKYVSGAIGTDSSGQGLNYTTVNLANWNITLDTPTNNFATVNSVEPFNDTVSTLVTGNLNIKAATYSSGNYGNHALTIPIPESGKWYIEWLSGIQGGSGNIASVGISKGNYFGLLIPNQGNGPHTFTGSTAMTMDTYSNEAHIYDGGSSVDSASSLTATSYVCAIAIDVDNNKFWGGYDNGSSITWLNSGNPATGANGASHTYTNESIIYASTAVNSGNSNRSYIIINSGAVGTFVNYKTAGGNTDGKGIGNFFYAPPSGFLALCTKNLPEPSIKLPKEHFNSVGYAGVGGNQTVTGVGHEPDTVWIKNRSNSSNHQIANTVAGFNYPMYTNLANQTEGDGTGANRVGVANADGFTILGAAGNLNSNGDNYSAFCWKGGTNTTVSESGSGTSRINACTYSANPTAGFSIIEYTGSNDEISNSQHTKLTHGLNQGPDYVMIIQTDSGNNWCIMSSAMVGTSSGNYGYSDWHLNMDGYDAVDGGHYVCSTDPDSNYFYLGNDNLVNDDGGDQYICYAWHSVPGFSKAGSYYGNGAAEDGPMVYTGFRPRFVLAKRESGSGTSWFIWDRSFSDFHSNVIDVAMWASDVNGATQHAQYEIDFLSNGFKIRGDNGGSNNSGSNYLYLAFADAPFKYSNAF